MIEMVLKPKRFNFEEHFGSTQSIKYEPRSNLSQHETLCINIDDPLFAGARFELKDFNINVTWPNVEQIGFYDCNLTHIEPGSLKGSDFIKYLIMIINFYFDFFDYNKKGLENANEIFLTNNRFRTLRGRIFEGLVNVDRIHMFQNKSLRRIGSDLFEGGLLNLSKIDLGGCALESIDLDMFKCVPNLRCLVINNEKLFNREFKESLRKSKELLFDII